MTKQDSTALARAEEVAGVYHAIAEVNEHLKLAASEMNLIAPATRCAALPPGCGVSLNVIRVDPTVDDWGNGPDVFQVDGGKLAPSKHVIDRIGAAIGIDWDSERSRRTDDRTILHYWSYQAVGTYRAYDMTRCTLLDEHEWDARDASARVEEAWEKPRRNYQGKEESDDVWQKRVMRSVRQMRKFGLQRAVSGARLRAMSDIGFKRSYTPAELARPFVVARLHFSGQSDDPEERRIFAAHTAQAMIGGTVALYPRDTGPATRALPAAAAAPPARKAEPRPAPAPEPEPEEEKPVITIPDGPNKGTPIGDADNVDLEYWARSSDDKEVKAACAAELKHRAEGGERPGEQY